MLAVDVPLLDIFLRDLVCVAILKCNRKEDGDFKRKIINNNNNNDDKKNNAQPLLHAPYQIVCMGEESKSKKVARVHTLFIVLFIPPPMLITIMVFRFCFPSPLPSPPLLLALLLYLLRSCSVNPYAAGRQLWV